MKNKIIKFGVFSLACAIAITHLASADAPKAKVFIQVIDLATAGLDEKQTKVLDRIKKSPSTTAVCVVKLYADAIGNTDFPVELQLSTGCKLEIKGYKVVKGFAPQRTCNPCATI